MKKTPLLFFVGLLTSCALPCHAERPFFWSVEVGSSTIDIEDRYYINDYDSPPKGLVMSSYFGYQFDNRWQLGGGLSYVNSSVSAGIFDDEYAFAELRAFTGYSFKVNEHFHLVPMIGVTKWSLYTDEASIYGSDSEPEDSMDGTDIYGQLNAEFPLGQRFSLSLSYSQVTTAPAQVSTTKLGFIGRF